MRASPDRMNAQSVTLSLDQNVRPVLRRAASIMLSVLFTLALFYGISRVQRTPTSAPSRIEDLTSITLPFDAPPPLAHVSEMSPVPVGTPVQFEVAAEAGPVKIQIQPAPLSPMDVSAPLARPGLLARFELGAGVVKTQLVDDPNHVFEKSEVDQPPVVVYRDIPEVSTAIFKRVPNPRVVLLFIVSVDGTVQDPHLLKSSADPELDQLMLDMILNWKFRPAVKHGKVVRCLIQQGVHINPPAASRFSTD